MLKLFTMAIISHNSNALVLYSFIISLLYTSIAYPFVIDRLFSSEATLLILLSVHMSVRPYVCQSVCLPVWPPGLGRNVIFSVPNYDNGLISSSYATYGCYHPCFFLYSDVIIVEPLYRLGPFGFTYLGIPEAPGNQGFMDVVKALEWVQINIGKCLYLIWRYRFNEFTFYISER